MKSSRNWFGRIAGHRFKASLRRVGLRVFARIAGLPTSLRRHHLRPQCNSAARVRRAYASRYWQLDRPGDYLELALALLLVLPVLVLSSLIFLRRNGAIVAERFGRPLGAQLVDHFRLFWVAGLLPPWYYIYELYGDPATGHARSFITRWENKGGINTLLKEQRPPRSVVSDKIAFERHCRAVGIPVIPTIGVARDGVMTWSRSKRDCDWFVKPVGGKGGRGIERWDRVGTEQLRKGKESASIDTVIERLSRRSAAEPFLIQPRIENHPALSDLNNGALATVRALTCLDEEGRPELVAAVFRMAIGDNNVIDNVHAGGIVAAIDLDSGTLGPATDLGTDLSMGWLDAHPATGAPITGRVLPYAERLKPFAERAHRAFADRTLIGWDIAITAGGLVVVEANGAPDLDIMQRPSRRGMMRGRLGELLAFHLAAEPERRSAA